MHWFTRKSIPYGRIGTSHNEEADSAVVNFGEEAACFSTVDIE